MTFSATLDRIVRFYRENCMILAALAVAGGLRMIPFVYLLNPSTVPGGKPKPAGPGILLIYGIAVTVLSAPVYGALNKAALAVIEGHPVRFGAAYRAAFSRLPSLIGSSLLFLLVTSVGMVLLVFPGLYFALGFSLSAVAIMAEGTGALASLRRSWQLVSGQRLRLLGLLMVWALLHVVLSYALGGAL